jgi:hypothetical protein
MKTLAPIYDTSASVADPGCLSRIPDPDFYPSRIPNLGSRIQKQQQRERWKKIFCHTFLCSHKFHKIVNYFSFEVLKEKFWANFQRIIELFTKKIVKKLLNIWSWDPGSEIRDPEKNLFRIPDPRVKKAPDPGYGSATLTSAYTDGVRNKNKLGRITLRLILLSVELCLSHQLTAA